MNIATVTYLGNIALIRCLLDGTTRNCHNKCNLTWSTNLKRKNSGLCLCKCVSKSIRNGSPLSVISILLG